MQLFREQIAQHVASVAVSFETADQQLKDLFTAVTASHEKLKATTTKADAASESATAASTAVENLTARLKKVLDTFSDSSLCWYDSDSLKHAITHRQRPLWMCSQRGNLPMKLKERQQRRLLKPESGRLQHAVID